jgi:SpoVK/Ycf46/Vps4 family AAA+-type ATPase
VRSGRFDLKIKMDLPGEKEIKEIFKLKISNYNFEESLIEDNFLDYIASKLNNLSEADIELIAKKANVEAKKLNMKINKEIIGNALSKVKDQDPCLGENKSINTRFIVYKPGEIKMKL